MYRREYVHVIFTCLLGRELTCLHTVKLFQVSLTEIILFNMNHLFARNLNGFKY